jgi:hypothetical protein
MQKVQQITFRWRHLRQMRIFNYLLNGSMSTKSAGPGLIPAKIRKGEIVLGMPEPVAHFPLKNSK